MSPQKRKSATPTSDQPDLERPAKRAAPDVHTARATSSDPASPVSDSENDVRSVKESSTSASEIRDEATSATTTTSSPVDASSERKPSAVEPKTVDVVSEPNSASGSTHPASAMEDEKLTATRTKGEPETKDTAPAATTASTTTKTTTTTATDPLKSRMERFKSLQLRQRQSAHQNLIDSAEEQRRLSTDPSVLVALQRKHAIASQKLLQLEHSADDGARAGEPDFERKRAWDWTIDESERWDRRMEEKEEHRRQAGFQDYGSEAVKAYGRQVREMKVDRAAYERRKMEAVEEAAKRGGLEIIETDEGELIAVDRDGSFYSTAEWDAPGASGSADGPAGAGASSSSFSAVSRSVPTYGTNRPDRAAIDRLVADMKKAEAERLKKRRKDRAKLEDDGSEDVTYINMKNKQFNDKLRRFYDKYTVGIRESFERGTAV